MQTQFAYLEPPEADVAAALPGLIAQAEASLAGASTLAIGRIVGMISAGFPAARVTQADAAMRVELYSVALADMPEDALQSAMIEGVKVWRYFPTVAEIREQAEPFVAERRKLLKAMRNLSFRAGGKG